MRHDRPTKHAKSRAAERFGLDGRTLWDAVRKIVGGEATFIRGRHEHEIWTVEINGREVPIVFDPRDNTIVTVLPRHTLKYFHRERQPHDKSNGV